MKINNLVLLIIIVAICSCKSNRTPDKDETTYFQGKIYYDITYSNINKELEDIDLANIEGNRAILTYKEGNYKKEYYNNEDLIMAFYHSKDEQRLYMAFKDSDTTTYYYTYNTEYITEFESKKTESILGYNCMELIIQSSPIDSSIDEFVMNSRIAYTSELRIDPKWYKKFIDGSQDIIYQHTQGLPLKQEKIKRLYNSIETATKIIEETISKEDLNVPSSKPIKEWNYGK